jgi:transcriptional regulator with XRE-family HTH domain
METAITAVIGARLRQMRLIRGQSLREQARLIGMSPSTLSELERGVAGISLQRLQTVANELGVSVSELLASDRDRGDAQLRPLEIISQTEQNKAAIERGKGVHYALLGESGSHTLQPYRIVFNAGSGYSDDPIGHPGEEFTLVLYGEVILHLGKEKHVLTQGTVARFSSEIPHAFSNASTQNVAAIVGAGTPPW